MSDLHALLEKIETAEGPSRELDRKIVERFGSVGPNGVPNCAGYVGIAAFTSSIDASLSLVERLLPGAWAEGTLCPNSYIEVHNNEVIPPLAVGRAATPALAIIAALIRALIAKETANV